MIPRSRNGPVGLCYQSMASCRRRPLPFLAITAVMTCTCGAPTGPSDGGHDSDLDDDNAHDSGGFDADRDSDTEIDAWVFPDSDIETPEDGAVILIGTPAGG